MIDPLTARKFKNTKECIIEIGNNLGADYVVVGEVDPSMDAVKVHAKLFQVSTNRQVWASEGELPRRSCLALPFIYVPVVMTLRLLFIDCVL